MVILPSAIEAINADIVLGPVTSPHAIVDEILLKQFRSLLKEVISPLLQDPSSAEVVIAGLEGLADSIRHFDATLADSLKLVIDKLRIRLNVLQVMRVDFEA